MDDYTAGITKLNADIAAGNVPDIMVINNQLPVNSYIEKGLFEDLNPYIEKDEELDRITSYNVCYTKLLRILFVTIMSLINSFKVFREVYLLTGDYPFDTLYMLQHFMNNTFRSLDS